jgi:hypothetical protein
MDQLTRTRDNLNAIQRELEDTMAVQQRAQQRHENEMQVRRNCSTFKLLAIIIPFLKKLIPALQIVKVRNALVELECCWVDQ